MKARLTPSLFAHAEAVLTQVWQFAHPADAVVSRYFREHRNLGHADRGFVAETVFAVLRHKRSLDACCGPNVSHRRRLLAALARERSCSLEQLTPLLKANEAAWLEAVVQFDLADQPPAVRCDLPDWLYAALSETYPAAEIEALAQAMNQSAPLDLRANTMKVERDALLAELQASGMQAVAGSLSPLCIRLQGKPALQQHPRFLDGSFEVQDEGSQLLGLLLAPKRGEMVADFCAGAGGKTLLLGALMKNTGRLYAFDVSEKRLANLKPRLARSGLSNVHPARIEHERDQKVKRLAGKLDRVLVDAPCSGLGTLRRNPDLKWRQTPEGIAEINAKQASILASAASLLRPGGRLVYATCSVLTAENDAIVDQFLAQHPDFKLISAADCLHKQGVAWNGERLQLLPHLQPTDGFYAAVMERNH